MSRQSEKLHAEISKVSEELHCSFVEAVLEFCQSHQLEPEDVVKQMDDITKDRLRQSAIDERMVRKATSAIESQQLPLE